MDFFYDLLRGFVRYFPLISGAYISILILRYPDLTIEASWSLGAISACLVVRHIGCIPTCVAPFFGLCVGILCGCLTSVLFVVAGRAKFLAGLISYYVLTAIGFHLLGDAASINLEHKFHYFGFVDSQFMSMLLYGLIVTSIFIFILVWQKSSLGIRSRIIGEKPTASSFYRISLEKCFFMGLVLSNGIVGLGGGLWGTYYGFASNAQGIGLVIIAFLALLIGDELVKLLKVSNRTTPFSIVLGCFVFVLLSLVSEDSQLKIALMTEHSWFRPTDKQLIIAGVLVAILWFRRSKRVQEGKVSEW